jgi:hypothetical protein
VADGRFEIYRGYSQCLMRVAEGEHVDTLAQRFNWEVASQGYLWALEGLS